jgi:hypothetical protein
MMHAVDQRTLEDFLPNLRPLDSEQQKILDGNYDYFTGEPFICYRSS